MLATNCHRLGLASCGCSCRCRRRVSGTATVGVRHLLPLPPSGWLLTPYKYIIYTATVISCSLCSCCPTSLNMKIIRSDYNYNARTAYSYPISLRSLPRVQQILHSACKANLYIPVPAPPAVAPTFTSPSLLPCRLNCSLPSILSIRSSPMPVPPLPTTRVYRSSLYLIWHSNH